MRRWILTLALGLSFPVVAMAVPQGTPLSIQALAQQIAALIYSNERPGTPDATGSVALTTAATDIWAASSTRLAWRLQNTDYLTETGGGGATIWCRWGTAALAPASKRGVGSFMLAAGQDMAQNGTGIVRSALNCLAESGTPTFYAEQDNAS